MCFLANKCGDYFAAFILISSYNFVICDTVANKSLNPILRDYTANDTNNLTHVKSLQMEESSKRNFQASNPIKFKAIRDSELSSSSNSRGLLIHDHSDYNLNDYEEGPHYEYGHEYSYYEPHHDPYGSHGYEHYGYVPHYYVGHHNYDKGHGHYYKYPKHALAAKAALWPLAGIALLGAAAALVTNPVLLQLGVISGKRRRRDTEEIIAPDFIPDAYYKEKLKVINIESNTKEKIIKNNNFRFENSIKNNFKKNVIASKKKNISPRTSNRKKGLPWVKPSVDSKTYLANRYDNFYNDVKFVPVPIKIRSNLSKT